MNEQSIPQGAAAEKTTGTISIERLEDGLDSFNAVDFDGLVSLFEP